MSLDESDLDRLFSAAYEELRRLAAGVRGSDPSGTLNPTSLVNEAYLRLVGRDGPGWECRAHFFNAAARAMRDIIVEQARRHGSLKRGGDRRRITFDEAALCLNAHADDLLALDEALRRLEETDGTATQVVMLRYFGGLGFDETAAAMGLSRSTVLREWAFARAWLRAALDEEVPRDA